LQQKDATATELHGKEGKKTPSVIFANAEIHIYSKARMAPRIREGDQGANKKGIKAFSPRRRKERKGKQQIITCLLLLSVLRVFAVKILGDISQKLFN
jgi:F420-0:gamma-glutamyl ligase